MNIVELHKRIDYHLDRARSPRYSKDRKDAAINIATDIFVRDRYDNVKRKTGYGFQTVQKLRDDLGSLVKSSLLVPANNIITRPDNYRHEVMVRVKINGKWDGSSPTSYDAFNTNQKNRFHKAEIGYVQHLELGGSNVEFYFGSYGNFQEVEYFYLSNPIQVSFGTTAITSGSLVVGNTYYVESGSITHNAIVVNAGSTFVAVGTTYTGTGVVYLIVNSELPAHTHEELAKMAASDLAGTTSDRNRKIIQEADVQKA